MSSTLTMPRVEPSVSILPRIDVRRLVLIANCLALVAVAVWFRCWRLGSVPGVNGDEAWYGVQALEALRGEAFSLRTPSGNVLNPLFLGPLVLLHSLFAPSFWLLRTVAVASGLIAIGLNYFLCRRVFGSATAILSTLVIAILPVNIAYSRFAWDSCQSLPATLLALYLPLLAIREPAHRRRWMLCGVFALGAAVLVHPTNVFAAPLLLAAGCEAYRREIAAAFKGLESGGPGRSRIAAAIAALLAGWLGVQWLPCLAVAWQRVMHPAETVSFCINYLRLFSGATVYRFIPGSIAQNHLDVFDALSACIALAAGWGFYRLLGAERRPLDRALIAGWGLGCLAFLLFAGPAALEPHFERYGIVLIAPGVLVLSRGAAWFCRARGPYRRGALVGLAAIAWLTLVGFYVEYFRCFELTGGLSHHTFRTAATEPKQASLEYVLRQRTDGRATEIVTAEWWNYWPLAYLALGQSNVRVLHGNVPDQAEPGYAWFVEFSDSDPERDLLRRFGEQGIHAERTVIPDAAGRPLLSVYGPVRKTFPNN